jgi:SAM-dependent methyltransferase
MYALLPDLKGKSVLSVGCGTGEECRHLKDLGASRVLGIDNAPGMIHIARESWPDIEWQVMDMEHLELPENEFDFVYSSLVMHYAQSWTTILANLKKSMKPGATMLLSTTHPIWHAMEMQRIGDQYHYELSCDMEGEIKYAVTGDYLTPRRFDVTFFDELATSFYYRPLSAMINDISASGLVLDGMWEPTPIEEAKAKKKNFWAIHQRVPWLLIFRLRNS